MAINVEKLNAKLEEHRKATEARNASPSKPADQPASPPARPRVSAYRGQGFDDFGDLVASGDFSGLVVRGDELCGYTFTLKAVLTVRARSVGVYMHGAVKTCAEIMPLIDRLLRKGDWHEDKYFRASPPPLTVSIL